jgi:hypothetical protein
VNVSLSRRLVFLAVTTLTLAVTTRYAGWWAVAGGGFGAGLASRGDPRGPVDTAIAAVAGWTLLLLWQALHGPADVVATRVAGVMGIPALVLVLVTLLFPGLLAWSSATVARTMATRRVRGRPWLG